MSSAKRSKGTAGLNEGIIGYLQFEDSSLPVRENDTIASCLFRAGILRTGTTKRGEPRGVFCGIGVCQNCVLEVEGEMNVRACVCRARPGTKVNRMVWR